MPFRPNEITRDHVLNAISKIERENISLIPSTRYDVIVNGKSFPPKEVMRYAHEQLDGDKRWEYPGGPQTFRYLEQLGFQVQKKPGLDEVRALIEKYKSHIKKTQLADEIYKWKLVEKFKGRPNLDAPNFTDEILSINYGNLLYQMGRAVMVHIAKERPEPYRLAFKKLFREEELLQSRIGQFQSDTLQIYRQLEPKLSSHHDERTISIILTFRFPDKYAFYKDGFYRNYCALLGVKSAKTGSKYIHYLELLNDLLTYIAEDPELISLVESYLPSEAFKDSNHLILAQDILYQMLDKTAKSNYWVFQSHPRTYDLVADLRAGQEIESWSVAAHRDKIKPGDKVILWAAGPNSGCYALAEIVDDVREVDGEYRVDLAVTNNLIDNPILLSVVQATPALATLKVGRQGTNFSATKEEFETILGLASMPNPRPPVSPVLSHSLNQILYGPPGTGKTYNSIDKAVEIADGTSRESHLENKIRFDQLRQAGQIEFVTFHQNYSYEDFMVGIRPDVDNEDLRFQAQKGILYRIARRARDNYEQSKAGKGRQRDFNEVLAELLEPLNRGEKIPIQMASGIYFEITDVSERSIGFTKHSGGRDHTLSIATLRDIVEGNRSVLPGGLAWYYTPLANRINAMRATEEPAEQKKNFVLIIDEINRANISRVFGELITLLEEDKRLGGENELKVTLPNGEKDFAVPPNLFIIGTMNTADKSIALIDIALRRRFEFVGFYPRYDLVNDEAASLLREINTKLYQIKKSADYLVGHAYFMNNTSTEVVLRNKVVPLLMEYLGGKTEAVSSIFSNTNWAVTFNTESYDWEIFKS